jgi:hypothetical protein
LRGWSERWRRGLKGVWKQRDELLEWMCKNRQQDGRERRAQRQSSALLGIALIISTATDVRVLLINTELSGLQKNHVNCPQTFQVRFPTTQIAPMLREQHASL